ncbi:MAG: SET domain-containing protein-lysine N-methyltransferase [Pseudomonadota bacterium]
MALVWFSPKAAKRASGIEGRGLFAVALIAAGEVVVVKGGHVFDRAMRDRVEPLLGPSEIQIGEDLFIGPVTPAEREGGMMHLNHSCAPNLGLMGEMTFGARRDIAEGEELSFDYATGDDDDWEMDCTCGAAACRGRITGQDWRLLAVRAANAGWFAPYLARRIAAEAGADRSERPVRKVARAEGRNVLRRAEQPAEAALASVIRDALLAMAEAQDARDNAEHSAHPLLDD